MAESGKRPTEAFRDEHRDLLVHVEQIRVAASEVTELAVGERETVVGRVLEFLRKTLLPHAEWEEQVLYTAVGELLGDAKATATMSRDHVAIGRMIEALAEADRADVARLQELLYGLHALITVPLREGGGDLPPASRRSTGYRRAGDGANRRAPCASVGFIYRLGSAYERLRLA